jgi:hypothetical protein
LTSTGYFHGIAVAPVCGNASVANAGETSLHASDDTDRFATDTTVTTPSKSAEGTNECVVLPATVRSSVNVAFVDRAAPAVVPA